MINRGVGAQGVKYDVGSMTVRTSMVMMVMLAMTVVLGCELVSVRRSFSWSDCCLQERSQSLLLGV